MTMDVIRCRSSACDPFGRSPVLPSRPDLNAAARPSRLQPQSQTDASAWPDAGLVSLRGVACIMTVSLIACFPFEAQAYAQNVSNLEPAGRFAGFITEASDRFVVPARWICAVIQIESGGDEHATSPRGAMGLMQIMPGTWVELSARYRLGLDPFDPHDNILAGAAYLRQMYDRFGSVGFLAAYNAGPLRYEQHLTTGRPLPAETLAYVAAVSSLLAPERNERDAFGTRRAVPWRYAPLFIERLDAPFADHRSAPNVRQTYLSGTRLTVGSSTLAPLSADLFVRPSNEGPSR
jgi:hypothetical protein